MRNKIILCMLFILPFLASSCKKDSLLGDKMSASINGKSWSPNARVTILQNGMFTITGTSFSGEVITITIKGENEGKYDFAASQLEFRCLATYTPSALDPGNSYASTSGTVELTKVDKVNKTISGTFQFTVAKSLTDIKTIQNGVFTNLSYSIEL